MELPAPSAVTTLIAGAELKHPSGALPLEVFHNLQHQHNWTDLRLHRVVTTRNQLVSDASASQSVSSSASKGDCKVLISGLPPRQMYIHPDLLSYLIQHNVEEDTLPLQREWVMPMSIGETWSLERLSSIFDSLPNRPPVKISDHLQHQDSKRIFLGMLAHNGAGGDGTIVYYIMQEGEVKPRQN